MNINCRDNEDLVFRNKKAGNAFGALRKCLFSNPNISFDAIGAVHVGLILSIILYGAKFWCLTKKLFSLLHIFYKCCVRSMCRVTVAECYNFRISDDELLRRSNLRKTDDYVTKRQLRCVGHVTRMDFDQLPRKMLSSWVCIKLPIGAPELTYSRGLYKSLRKAAVNVRNWHALALDKSKWIKIIYDI